MKLKEIIRNNMEDIIKLREKLSDNAELSFQEFKTSKIVKDYLEKLDIQTQTVFNTGVVGVLNSGDSCIAIRADMDGLPVNGVSHACGHDYHMAVALGCALVLKEIGFKKCVKFIFQPAEEDTGGAAPMIKEGVLKSPDVAYIIGFHIWPNVEVGKIEVTSGPSMGSVDDFYITFNGKGGHAAMPNLCKNPIYPSIDFIQSMNTKIHTENNPLNSCVLTFSSMNVGNAPNVIADCANLSGTFRTFDNELRAKIKEDIKSLSSLCAKKYNCEVDVRIKDGYPPVVSDKVLTDKFISASKSILGEENVLGLEKTFAAEDFAFFAEKIPSVHFRLGIYDGCRGKSPLHATDFDASDEALYYGIYTTVNFILSMENELT
ncbi:M20 metallopeptidase family protein [Clostridium aciditolerans]|uniref:Amidohydrolase n=1 Tax=Clostridium aciditolerans TaxID=339861 RepID=A0A934HT78_9CLOT|nr:M20 family metallopeptidase [Clostridium aciditolerans]MBI6873890.1 amidohydrolase [Clostridium aciditolerans]